MSSLILGLQCQFAKSGQAAGGLGSMMQALSLFLGLIVIIISLTTFITGMAPAQVLGWGLDCARVEDPNVSIASVIRDSVISEQKKRRQISKSVFCFDNYFNLPAI